MSAVTTALTSSRDVRGNVRTALSALQKSLGLAFAFYLRIDGDNDNLIPLAASGLDAQTFRRLDQRVDRTTIRNVYESSEAIQMASITENHVLHMVFEGFGGSFVAVPAMTHGETTGVLAAGLESNHGPAIEKAKSLLMLVAQLIAHTMRIEQVVQGERKKLRDENTFLKQELKEKYDFSHIIGTSSAMKQVYDQVTMVARANATVLLRGESGTGKELIANAIHYNSLRSKRPLIKVNCAALPESLIESELFGHEKGAFTGADRVKKGRFELADGGTLFLDEIGEIPLQTQIKLLRVLQEREFERVGGNETIKTNIRLIAATNKNLEEAIRSGEFREDLYYRLNVFSIFLPPLRERKPDILLLAEHFVEKYESEHGKRIRRISTPAIDMLMSYHFPGNVRELENAIERAVLLCDSNVIHGHHLPATLQTAEVTGTVTDLSLDSAVEAFERDLIQDALKSNKGNIAKTARSLGSTERIVGYKIKKYAIDTIRFRK